MAFGSHKKSKVKQTGNTLVAAYHSANPPLIWKFDLERNHSFTLALHGDDGDWELGVTSPKEEFHPVARFMSREDAEEAFSKTQKALLCGKKNIWKRITLLIIVILILVYVVLPVGNYILRVNNATTMNAGAVNNLYSRLGAQAPTPKAVAPPVPSAPPAEPPAIQEGIPMPADQVLKPPSS